MLLARSSEKNVAVEIDYLQGTSLVLEKGSGRCRTAIMDIPLNEITGSLVKNYSNKMFQFEFEVGVPVFAGYRTVKVYLWFGIFKIHTYASRQL